MLQELSIRNFAIIEDLTIRFESGLTILSGETGAGKSIIINAVNLLLGSRASAALIRTGAESAELEAFFEVGRDTPVAALLAEQGYDPDEGLMVRRIISSQDRHRIYINGRLATMQLLGALTANLASISGQHAHQGLLREEEHLLILDQFGDLLPLREEYARVYQQLAPLIRKEQDLLRKQANQAEQIDLLRFQKQEIEAAGLLSGEDEMLEKERLRLRNSAFLIETVEQCVHDLYSSDGAMVETLGRLGKALEKAAGMDEGLEPHAATLADLTFKVEDLAVTLRGYLKGLDLDPRQLDTVEARLDALSKLKRKYGGSIQAALDFGERITGQLQEMENLDDSLAEVRQSLQQAHEQLAQLARQLSQQRIRAGKQLARRVEGELDFLKMADTRFAVDLQPLPATRDSHPSLSLNGHALGEWGCDRATFMIAPNVGETIKPLAGIASGGELSRMVLALKAILAKNQDLETVVFDEVDAGIGGATAEAVGQKLADLAGHHQILCITHLPQIAKFGHHHFRITKSVSKGRTRTTITPLRPEERVEELARMLGGENITAATLAHAREMLAR